MVDAATVLAALDQLPPLPMLIQQMLSAAASEAQTVAVAEVLDQDARLAGRVRARFPAPEAGNSQRLLEFGGPEENETVCHFALTLMLMEFMGFGERVNAAGICVGEFWRHSFAVARLSASIARLLDRADIPIGAAGVAGLLHDLGKPALATVYPKAYARIVAETREMHGDITEIERRHLGVDHTIAGRRIAEAWALPQWLQEAIWLHHLAPDALREGISRSPLIAVVRLADTIARCRQFGVSGNYAVYASANDLARRLEVDEFALDAVVRSVAGDDARLGGALLETPAGQDAGERPRRPRGGVAMNIARMSAGAPAGQRAVAGRYLSALAAFFGKLSQRTGLGDVVAAVAAAASEVCECEHVAAFGIREHRALAEVRWHGPGGCDCGGDPVAIDGELTHWLDETAEVTQTMVIRAPRALRNLVTPPRAGLAEGDLWVLPIQWAGRVVGGILLVSAEDEQVRLARQSDELGALLTCLGTAIGRTNAQAAAMRLAEELAENNRRMQRTQSDALRSRTLASIADFAAGAGHELNSPLAVISGRAQMLQDSIEDNAAGHSLRLIIDKAHECSDIVRELMEFAQPRALHTERVSPAELLHGTRESWLKEGGLPASRLTLEIEEDLPMLVVDRGLVEVALDELIRNAIDASQADLGLITVRAQRGVTPGLIEIVVRDTGRGMTAAVQGSAFEPFFSHRSAGRGRGLGLPRAHRIITAHDGHIWLESRVGEGTDAHVLLPAVIEGEGGAAAGR
ncbi:MAG: HDOD domain-containing protein [Phycisphaerae bacterium]|nr:HDOD domain-containing protein [Phycisphaerae bacterium]